MIEYKYGHYIAFLYAPLMIPAPYAIHIMMANADFLKVQYSNSSTIQNNSVTLYLVVIARIICNYLIFTYKRYKIFARLLILMGGILSRIHVNIIRF